VSATAIAAAPPITPPDPPRWIRPRRIVGRTLSLRDAQVSDAAFILALRTDEEKSRHMSPTPPDLVAQQRYLERYRASTDGLYFIIESLDGEPLGTMRLYDAQGDSFCWGSWIVKHGAPSTTALESVLILFSYALNHLGFKRAHFRVQPENTRVWAFHERFGAVRVLDTPEEYEYRISPEAIDQSLQRYKRFLPDPIVVEHEPQ
jgi:RimJ/RimL family protein N-acetyltransferase